MPKVEIYSMGYCPYCIAAKRILAKLGWEYREVDITGKPKLKSEMMKRTQRHTVPQIFLDKRHIGGFDDFSAYVQKKQLI
ncbi:MAG: glutaredoxin 3 [Neptuniibacter sp.]|uniref:glutaredoxin 3 n=1 Tax=Neptuniibacter sp. TaxID=1962643 RepID=UPI003B5B8EE5